jgi:hypothetical protein
MELHHLPESVKLFLRGPLVPGNNDVKYNKTLGGEDPEDREAYKAFVDSLSHEVPGRVRDLSGEAKTSWDAPSDVVSGYALIGMDTASFKTTDEEGKRAAPYTRSTGSIRQRLAHMLDQLSNSGAGDLLQGEPPCLTPQNSFTNAGDLDAHLKVIFADFKGGEGTPSQDRRGSF